MCDLSCDVGGVLVGDENMGLARPPAGHFVRSWCGWSDELKHEQR